MWTLDPHVCSFRRWSASFCYLPLISIPNILKLLHDFGMVSGLQVNMLKSSALNVTIPAFPLVERLKNNSPFSWNSLSIPYLGANLAANIDQLYTVNYPSIYKKLSEDLTHWARSYLSWLGRVILCKWCYCHSCFIFSALSLYQFENPICKSFIQKLFS